MTADDSSTFEETVSYGYSSVSNFHTFLIPLATRIAFKCS